MSVPPFGPQAQHVPTNTLWCRVVADLGLIADYLKEVAPQVWQPIDGEALRELARYMQHTVILPGTALFRQGEKANAQTYVVRASTPHVAATASASA